MKELRRYIDSLMVFPDKSWDTLRPALTEHSYHKGEDLLSAGKTCDALFFIVQGYCRSFFDKDDHEINTAFFLEGEIATNIASFGSGRPSEFSIRAGEAVAVIAFNKQKLREAAVKDPAIETLGRQCLQRIAGKQEKLTTIYQRLLPEERYALIELEYPELLQRIPLMQLASFLGVARETLSRIRSRRS